MSGQLTSLTLGAVLASRGSEKPATPSPPHPAAVAREMNRTLLDIIRDEEPHGSLLGNKDKKSWKAFRDRLRLKRAGASWTSTIHIPASEIPTPMENTNNNNNNPGSFLQNRSFMSHRSSVQYTTVSSVNPAEDCINGVNNFSSENFDRPVSNSARPLMARRSSSRYGASPLHDENIHAAGDEIPSLHNSTRNNDSPFIDSGEHETVARVVAGGSSRCLGAALAEERALSAREAVAAQQAAVAASEAAEVATAAAEEENPPAAEEAQPVRMSLMDLLEETDRQMGFAGSRYTVGDDDQDEEECEEGEDDGKINGGGKIEHTCCVCMVRHKGAAFIPCGHTFCRLCSRELWVQRGNCPLCNGFIAEILDIF